VRLIASFSGLFLGIFIHYVNLSALNSPSPATVFGRIQQLAGCSQVLHAIRTDDSGQGLAG
ncbi:MAG: hypothetical protein NTY38_26970, partial [Acidobacteria bacterium]|nr:hypothetical protein [Acidobacteriota bacterium]